VRDAPRAGAFPRTSACATRKTHVLDASPIKKIWPGSRRREPIRRAFVAPDQPREKIFVCVKAALFLAFVIHRAWRALGDACDMRVVRQRSHHPRMNRPEKFLCKPVDTPQTRD
jgi:hypothetical protein